MTFKEFLIEAPHFKFEKAEYHADHKLWNIFYRSEAGTLNRSFITDLGPQYLRGPLKFMDEELRINDRVLFIPKKIEDLKAEGWTEADRQRLIKGPFFMGKKKQQLLGKLGSGVLAVNAKMKLAIYSHGYFFLPDQIRFVIKPVANKYAVEKIRNQAARLTTENLAEFFKTLHAMSLE